MLPSSKVKNLEQKLNTLDNTNLIDNKNSNSLNNTNIFDQTQQYGSNEEIQKMNEMNDIVSQIPKVNVKEDYSKVYYISSSLPKIPRSKSTKTKAVNFSTSAPSVHILMDEESDNEDAENLKPEDDELSYEEFKKSVVKDEKGDIVCNNEENLEFFNSDEILNVIEKKLKYENEINLISSPTYGNYSMAKPISMSKKEIETLKTKGKSFVDLLSKEKLEVEEDDDDDDDYDDDDDNDEDNDDDDDDDDMICSSFDERNPMYTQRKEFLKQQMEKDVVIQQGYMYQYRKNALKKKWKKYWFVIRSGNLFIYKNEQEYVVKSIVPLKNTLAICEVKRTSRIGRKGKKNRIRYCFQLIQSIMPKSAERQYSVDSVASTITSNDSISNEFYNKNSYNEPFELSSSYSSGVSIDNNQNNKQNTNVNQNNASSINHPTAPVKQNSVSQLTNKIRSMNIEANKLSNNSSNSENIIESNNNEVSKVTFNTGSPDNKGKAAALDIDLSKKKTTTSILKVNTDNNINKNSNSVDSNNSLDGKKGLLANSVSPNNNMTSATPRRKTFVKVFTFSAPTETSRKIWIANLLNECEKVQENI